MTGHPGVDEECIERLEREWSSGNSSALHLVYHESSEQISLATLAELVIVDMEFRWKGFQTDAGIATVDSSLMLDEYLANYPQLNSPELIDRLLEEEFVIRRKYGDQPPVEWFTARSADALDRLQEMDRKHPVQKREPVTRQSATPATTGEFPVVPNFRILSEVGRGGMGSVFLAEQEHPVKRKVALKLIRSGMDSGELLARFDAERQALAMMDHPHIARIFHAGTAASGQPFFAMEFVDGEPISEYCRKNKLGVVDRLRLFIDICSAVQHAHQKGILHRDLKPSNILVYEENDRPVVKVIDFGLAKAVDHAKALTDETLQTHAGQVLGTLKYMSPEQADTTEKDIDTRSDVYTLGVILFELLTGETPLEDLVFQDQGVLTILQLIKEQEPVRPSTKLPADGSGPDSVALELGTSTRSLRHLLRGDLDWVVMKALENDRERRYESAAGLADDVRRFLDDEPVSARPPSASYRLKKFVRKNRLVVGSLTTMALLLVGGIIATSTQMLRAQKAEGEATEKGDLAVKRAEESEKRRIEAEKAREEERLAKIEAEEAEKRAIDVLGIVVESFRAIDPHLGANKNMLAADVLKLASKKTQRRFKTDPLGKAMLMNALSRSFVGIGEPVIAVENAKEAVRIRTEELGRDHELTNYALQSLAKAYFAAGEYEKAKEIGEEVLRIREATVPINRTDIAVAQNSLAVFYTNLDRRKEAIRLYHQSIENLENEPDSDPETLLMSMSNLGYTLQLDGQVSDAIQLFEELIPRVRDELGEDHELALSTLNHLGLCYVSVGRTKEAIALHKQDYELSQSTFGNTHPHTLTAMNGYATALGHDGQHDKAIDLLEKEISLLLQRFEPDFPSVLVAKNNLASNYQSVGETEKAVELNREILEIRIRKLGKSHSLTLASMNNLATGYVELERLDEAIELLEEVLAIYETKTERRDRQLLISITHLANAKLRSAPEESVELLESALRENESQRGFNDPLTDRMVYVLGAAYQLTGQVSQTIKLYRRAILEYQKESGTHSQKAVELMAELAAVHLEHGQTEQAVEQLVQLREIDQSELEVPVSESYKWYRNLALGELLLGRFDEAEATCRYILSVFEKNRRTTSSATAHLRVSLATALMRQGKNELANQQARLALGIKKIRKLDRTRADLILLLTDRDLGSQDVLAAARVKYLEFPAWPNRLPDYYSRFQEIACDGLIDYFECLGESEEAEYWKRKKQELWGFSPFHD